MQRRASLAVPQYRAQLEAYPEAIELPQLHLNAGLTFVVEIDGQVAGFAVVLPVGEGEAQLDGLFVEPALQRKGVGALLVETAVDFAIRALSASVLVVTANPAALAFYQRHGFLDIGVADTRFGPAPLMARALGG